MLLGLFACAAATDTGKVGETATDSPVETADTPETGDSGETGDSAETAETGDSAETGETGETATPPASRWTPPATYADADSFTVPADRGLSWEVDPDFAIENFTVPQVFRGPDGRYGMFATNMDAVSPDYAGRTLYWSDDGLSWTSEGALFTPDDVPYDCGTRFEDAAVWEDGDVYRFVIECSAPADDGNPLGPREFVVASTTDFATFQWDTAPAYTGSTDGEVVSVPYLLPVAEGAPQLFYNGDLTGVTSYGPGIRVADLDATTRLVSLPDPAPILPGSEVDPMPVYLEGGGLRLYHTTIQDTFDPWNLAVTDLDDALDATTATTTILAGEGGCDGDQDGTCYADPAFVHLDDDTLVLYFTRLVRDPYGYTATIGRAFATD